MTAPRYYPLIPGAEFPGDWFKGRIPRNIVVGENTVIDSSFSFQHFYSKRDAGLRVGRDVTFWRTQLAVEERGEMRVGDHCYLANALLICAERLSVGARVMIAGGVTVADTDFHPLPPAERLADAVAVSTAGKPGHRPPIETAPVSIGDDVWIGFNATILKGVTIGAGAVVEPGSLVLADVEAGARVGGNPARVLEAGAGP